MRAQAERSVLCLSLSVKCRKLPRSCSKSVAEMNKSFAYLTSVIGRPKISPVPLPHLLTHSLTPPQFPFPFCESRKCGRGRPDGRTDSGCAGQREWPLGRFVLRLSYFAPTAVNSDGAGRVKTPRVTHVSCYLSTSAPRMTRPSPTWNAQQRHLGDLGMLGLLVHSVNRPPPRAPPASPVRGNNVLIVM